MAEENKNGAAKEEMGELFVSIGATGLGGLLKGLSSASAGFIAVKHAAETIVKPIANAGKSSVEIGKLNSQLGGTHEQLQQIQAFFKQKGLSEGLIGDITQLQQYYAEFFRGKGFPDNVAIALGEMHIGWTEYTDSLESVLDLIQKIKDETSHMDKATRLSYLNEIGLSSEWAYIFDRGIDFNSVLSKNLLLNSKDIDQATKAAEALNLFKIELEKLTQVLIVKVLPAITPIIQKLNEFFANKDGIIGKIANKVGNTAVKPILSNPAIAVPLALAGTYVAAKNSINPAQVADKKLINLSETLPSNTAINNTGGNITINNENNFNTNESPSAIAQAIESLDYEQIQRNQYEITNRPGR